MSNLIAMPSFLTRRDDKQPPAIDVQPLRRLEPDLEDLAQAVERTRAQQEAAITAHEHAVAAFKASLQERNLCPKS